ncbi:spermatogenesis- and oogenesis-specific basic helix-loop-helix-containing protein 1 isoform X4 [Vulpes lagopus]|uniref:spermatogenesis- and oogenesis-specific basic helix-loop-helix-containing protein 1 isoform X4 n=1 Tax=Vulpes lagopus TaxID=494514 RepID=UPI001BC99A95|nr:spermatogenesis- and oogenesis-specific basic helix-loop-helix-containing protein 1 isoform X4 [Vulpes lagopus]
MACGSSEAGVVGCSGPSPPSARGCSEERGQGSGRVKAAPQRPGPGLPRNVLSERERRKRISVSCERLRALLPRFDGRREDMASVLEMSVQFLRLVGTLLPGQEQHTVFASSKEPWHKWQKDVTQLAMLGPAAAVAPDCGLGACGLTMPAAGCDVEDGMSFLLNASPDWWLGSLEGRGAGVPSRNTARSSLLDRAEPSFLTDPEPGSQELLGSPLEPWGSDVGCPSLALREEVDSIFPDFFPC